MCKQALLRAYQLVLQLYPPRFRDEFGVEMGEVFAQRLVETRQQGQLALLRLFLDELLGLPKALLLAYTTPDLKRAEHATATGPLAQPWRELLLVLVVFLLPAGMLLTSRSTFNLPAAPGVAEALLFLGVMLALGWMGGVPLWSRPYVGLVLVVSAYLYLFQWVAGQITPALISNFAPGPWDRSTYLVLQVASNGILWLMLFCLTLLAVALLAVVNRFQPLLVHLQHDWSLLSFILYGESVFVLLLFQSRRAEPGYLVASLLCLAAGVWFFLRGAQPTGLQTGSPGQRLLALLGCLTLAVAVLAVQNTGASAAGRETLLLAWGWMAAAVLLPGLLARLFTHRRTFPVGG